MQNFLKTTEWNIVSLIFLYKAFVIVLIFFAFSLMQFQSLSYKVNFVYPTNAPITVQTAYKTWDGFHYLFVSEHGYQKNNPSNAFAPLFPFFIRLGTFITHDSFWSGILLSNMFSFVAFYIFYLFVKREYSQHIAYKSLIFFLAFPTTFFTSLIYAESLFLFLTIISFYLVFKREIVLASFLSFFIPFSRLIGIGIFFPLVSMYLFDIKHVKGKTEVKDIFRFLSGKASLLILSPFLGFLGIFLLMYLFTGNPFEQFSAFKYFVAQNSVIKGLNIFFQIHLFFNFPLFLHGFTNSILDRLFFVFFILLLPLIYKYTSRSLFVYALYFGIIPILSGSYMSYMRHLLIIFPIFITLAILFGKKKYTFLEFPTLFVFLMLQTLFIVMQALNYWVA